MATLTNDINDKVEVKLGGFNGDNVRGTVKDRTGARIPNARVSVQNADTGDNAVKDPTGNTGSYDLDVNAAIGHRIYVHVEWRDGAGALHVVTGWIKLRRSDQDLAPADNPERELCGDE